MEGICLAAIILWDPLLGDPLTEQVPKPQTEKLWKDPSFFMGKLTINGDFP